MGADGGHRALAHLRGAFLGKEVGAVGEFRHVVVVEFRHPHAGLQVFTLPIEVELVLALGLSARIARDAVGAGHRLAEVLNRRARRDDGQIERCGKLRVGGVKAVVHPVPVDSPLGEPPVERRVGPRLLHVNLRLLCDAADFPEQVLAVRQVGFRPPTLSARLLEGDDVPSVRRKQVLDVRVGRAGFVEDDVPGDWRGGTGDAVVIPVDLVGAECRVRRGNLIVAPVVLERTATDIH